MGVQLHAPQVLTDCGLQAYGVQPVRVLHVASLLGFVCFEQALLSMFVALLIRTLQSQWKQQESRTECPKGEFPHHPNVVQLRTMSQTIGQISDLCHFVLTSSGTRERCLYYFVAKLNGSKVTVILTSNQTGVVCCSNLNNGMSFEQVP